VTEFAFISNGDVKPRRKLEQRFNGAEPELLNNSTNFRFYSAPNNPNNPPYVETQAFTYDPDGNLIGMRDEGNHVVSNIYDYNDKYVTASVINADVLIDKPAYTSFETSALGRWTLNGSSNYLSAGLTGDRSMALNSSTLSTQLNPTKPYKLSLWSNSSSVSLSTGGTSSKSGPTINGFTYYEYDINAGTSSVTVSGNATIDELRLYPKSARMRTVTYDPLIGKTSECDENNRVTYYDYDDVGRLRFVKDENKNIVKMYEYNTASNSAGCPATYYSKKTSEIFTKNTCTTGMMRDSISYIIPASNVHLNNQSV
jgi:hypothetical protein